MLVAVMIISMSTFLVYYFGGLNEKLQNMKKSQCKRLGEIHDVRDNEQCYCLNKIDEILSDDFQKNCLNWLKTYTKNQILVFGESLIVVTINVIA